MLEFIQNTDFALHIIRTEDSENDWAISTVSHEILITSEEKKPHMQHTGSSLNDSLVTSSLFAVVHS